MAVVYRHRRLDTNKIFYIGFSTNIRRPYRKDGRNNHWFKTVSKSNYSVEILASNLSVEEALELEEFLILQYGRQDLHTGKLVNKTSGGEYTKHSEETKEIIRQSKIGDKNPMFGKKQTKEVIEKRIQNNRGKKRTEETREKIKQSKVQKEISKPTILRDYKTNNILGEFTSLSDACKFAGLDIKKYSGKASLVANKKRNHIKGYSFEYKNIIIEKEIKQKDKQINLMLRRLILNLETGIFYIGLDEANASLATPIYNLYRQLNGSRKNNTKFIYV